MQGKVLVNRFQTAVKATNLVVQMFYPRLIFIFQTSLNQNQLKFILGFDFVMLQLSQVAKLKKLLKTVVPDKLCLIRFSKNKSDLSVWFISKFKS